MNNAISSSISIRNNNSISNNSISNSSISNSSISNSNMTVAISIMYYMNNANMNNEI